MLDNYDIQQAKRRLKEHEDEIKRNDFSWLESLYYDDRADIVAFLMMNGFDILKHLTALYKGMFLELDADKSKRIVIPRNVEEVRNAAFSGCKFETIIFNNTKIMQLPSLAFARVGTLKKIVLPSNLKIIPTRCFYSCNNLKEIEIPDSVQIIGKEAFYDCPDDLKITANYRTVQKIKAPKSDIEFLKTHLVFNHPVEEEDGYYDEEEF